MLRLMTGCLIFLSCSTCVRAEELPDPVRHLLEERCLSCHNNIDRQGDLSLQTRTELLDSGYVLAGDAENSELLNAIQSANGQTPRMPKDGQPLSAAEVEQLATWIRSGVPWSDDDVLSVPQVSDFDWWSWKPLHPPRIPQFADAEADNWIGTPVDAFILQTLREQGLSPSPPAARRDLIRRLRFDLTGLPPTPEEVTTFVDDPSADAFAALVEQFLASDSYGEHWARHWLDVVKYADTHGYDKDKLRPHAWPYRDYVIRSLNEDKPWQQFIREQIAGDAIYPGSPDGILGLGFLAAGPWDFIGHVEVPESKLDGKVARNLDRDDMVSNVLNSFCSVTVQCARCHNHKFDPITQEQYYSLQAVFAAVDRANRVFNNDPQTDARRQQLRESLAAARQSLSALDRSVRERAGSALVQLDQHIETLAAHHNPLRKSDRFGYHSQIAAAADTAKWVEVDLGRDQPIRSVILHPCHDDFAGIGSGFGLPKSLTVTCRDSTGTVRFRESITAAHSTSLSPLRVAAASDSIRFVRITAEHLAERRNDFIFALAEVEVLNAQEENVAAGAIVNAADSIEAPPRWQKTNLTDEDWAAYEDPALAASLAEHRAERTRLLDRATSEEDTAQRQRLEERIVRLQAEINALPEGQLVYAAATQFESTGNFLPTKGVPREVRLLARGEVSQPGVKVEPGRIPLTADDHWTFALQPTDPESSRRVALADWVASEDNPLTWRSMANRVWQYHFGRGLVDSPNDFGRMGQLPTHPQLLDWLACELRRTQSLKHLHRLILLSSTWQQVSRSHAEGMAQDADNRSLWRMNRRRLTAEEVRDAILQVSGTLNNSMYGPGFYLFELERTAHSPHYEYHKFDPSDPESHRRSIYRFIVRSQPDPFMTTLDCADSSQSTPRRLETQTALQSLALLNNQFILAMADRFAESLTPIADPRDRVNVAIHRALGREATAAELDAYTRFAENHGWSNLCRALFNLNEFVFID